MTTEFSDKEKKLLKQIIEDLITIYDLKDKTLLFLIKDGNKKEYLFFLNEFGGKIEYVKDKLKHDLKFLKPLVITANGNSKTDRPQLAERLKRRIKDFKDFMK